MMPGIKNQRWKKHELQSRIEDMSDSKNVPFFVLTESHLKSYIKDAEVAIPGYGLVRADRDTRSQGGVIIYYQDYLSATHVSRFSNQVCEVAMTLISQLNVIIIAIYRPPDTTLPVFQAALTEINLYLKKHSNNSDCDVMLMGDTNFPNVDWKTESVESGCSKNDRECFKAMQLIMSDHFLTQMVDVATRQNNILDVIMTNNTQLIRKTETEDTIMSDHKYITCYLGYKDNSKQEEEMPRQGFGALNLHKADIDSINEELEPIDWNKVIFQDTDAGHEHNADEVKVLEERQQDAFVNKVLEVWTKHTPPRSSKRKKPKCEHRAIKRRKKKTRIRLESLEITQPGSPEIEKLKDKLLDIELELRAARKGQLKSDEDDVIEHCKTNSKAFYAFANAKRTTKQRIGPLEDSSTGVMTNEPKGMADLCNTQFVQVFSDPNKEVPEKYNTESELTEGNHLSDLHFSPKDIEEAIDELQAHSAAGPDDFPAMVLKQCKTTLSKPLYMLWRKSLDTGIIPKSLLRQKIIPVYKKGSKTETQNYRPVSLTSHLIKVFERVLRKGMVTWLEANSKLSDKQHGFRKNKSCLTQLISHVESILDMMSKGSNADVIYLDFAKAFDKVSHKILHAKLRRIGIRGKLLDWLQNFLSDRVQFVCIEGKMSFLHLVLSGVPQGTVLGPLLFIIFIDDIYEEIKHSLSGSFADDTKLTKDVTTVADQLKLQEDLEAVIRWAATNSMELHEGKFQLIQHGKTEALKRDGGHQYQLSSGKTIENSTVVRDLGILIDEKLQWSNQIKEASQQASQTSAWVLRTFSTRERLPLMTLFKALIRPKIDYCCPVWTTTKKGDICMLESVQRSFTARIWSLKDMTYWERLKNLRLMSIQRRRERYIIIHTWKIQAGYAPNDLGLIFSFNDRLGLRCTVPKQTSSSMAVNTLKYNSFSSMGPMLFNRIPKTVKDKTTIETFKSSLDDYLMSLPDTPPTPGYVAANNNSVLDWTVANGRALSEVLS